MIRYKNATYKLHKIICRDKRFFFLERAGELRVVVLIGRKNGPITMPNSRPGLVFLLQSHQLKKDTTTPSSLQHTTTAAAPPTSLPPPSSTLLSYLLQDEPDVQVAAIEDTTIAEVDI